MGLSVPVLTYHAKIQKVTPVQPPNRISKTKGRLSKRTSFVREIVKEVAGYVILSPNLLDRRKSVGDKC